MELAIVSKCGIFCSGQKLILKQHIKELDVHTFATLEDVLQSDNRNVKYVVFKPENAVAADKKALKALRLSLPQAVIIGVFFNKEHRRHFKHVSHLDAVVEGINPEQQIIEILKHNTLKPTAENGSQIYKPDFKEFRLSDYYMYNQLSPTKRRMLIYFSQGKSVEEIAGLEQISETRVKRVAQELKKAFGLDKNASLEGFIDNLIQQMGS